MSGVARGSLAQYSDLFGELPLAMVEFVLYVSILYLLDKLLYLLHM